MKSLRFIVIALTMVIASAPPILDACWIDVPLADIVKKRPLVVVGEIHRIETAPKSQFSYDTAFIKIERVLKYSGTNQIWKTGIEVPLTMPSINNEMHTSTDIRYQKGQRGVWILDYNGGKFWAAYPKDFQPISEEPTVMAIIRKQASKQR